MGIANTGDKPIENTALTYACSSVNTIFSPVCFQRLTIGFNRSLINLSIVFVSNFLITFVIFIFLVS